MNLAEIYFLSWDTHDEGGICSIFREDAPYIILNKLKILRGSREVADYWRRNSTRQKHLIVKRQYVSCLGVCVALFNASFLDEEEGWQTIYGVITFIGRKQISIFAEAYYKKIWRVVQ